MNNHLSTTQNSIVIGCVTEPVPKYLQQASRLLLSLKWFGGKIADSPLNFMHNRKTGPNLLDHYKLIISLSKRIYTSDTFLPNKKSPENRGFFCLAEVLGRIHRCTPRQPLLQVGTIAIAETHFSVRAAGQFAGFD